MVKEIRIVRGSAAAALVFRAIWPKIDRLELMYVHCEVGSLSE